MLFKEKEAVLFIGDSVTDMGRTQPVGEGIGNSYGDGYVRIVHSFINAFYPELDLRIINMGVSGNNIDAMEKRWQTDVFDLKPDWVCMCIGINDVWRQFDCPTMPHWHVYPEQYEKTMEELIKKTLPTVKGMILMTPYYMEPLKDDPMRKKMDEYGDIVKKLAKKYDLMCIDFQKVYDEYLTKRHSSYIAWDRVHPNAVGATLMAVEFLKNVGFDKGIF